MFQYIMSRIFQYVLKRFIFSITRSIREVNNDLTLTHDSLPWLNLLTNFLNLFQSFMYRILPEDVPYASVLVRGISNKFWLTDLLLYLFFPPTWVSPVNVLASSFSCSSLYINRQLYRETRSLNLSVLHCF